MTASQTYSADDVSRIVELLRGSDDLPEAELTGMAKLADLLKLLEGMTPDVMEREATRVLRSLRGVDLQRR